MNPYKGHVKQEREKDPLQRARALVAEGKRVEAVRLYRQAFRCDLKTALAALEPR